MFIFLSSLPIISQNFYDIGFRIVEFGVVLWFPCVLWNCKRYIISVAPKLHIKSAPTSLESK